MQGFTTKYDLCKAERGDFVGNRQAVTLNTRKGIAAKRENINGELSLFWLHTRYSALKEPKKQFSLGH